MPPFTKQTIMIIVGTGKHKRVKKGKIYSVSDAVGNRLIKKGYAVDDETKQPNGVPSIPLPPNPMLVTEGSEPQTTESAPKKRGRKPKVK